MKILEETGISLEVTHLLAIGLIMLALSTVLFSVVAGALPYYEDGVYGLLLIMFGLQLQTIGKTPIGSVKRSWPGLISGVVITAIGFATCFIPGVLGDIPKVLVMIIFGAGSSLLLLQLLSADEVRRFRKTLDDGVVTRLTVSGAAVYILEILIAVLIAAQIYRPFLISTEILAVVALLFGIALFYLASMLQKVHRLHSESEISTNTPGASLYTIMGMQFGLYMLVLGCLLVPVNLGLLPYATSAMHGALIVLLGVQALVSGTMMTFAFTRNWIFFLVGMVLVAVGAFAIIVPDTIVEFLILFIGVFVILGGLHLLYTLFWPKPKSAEPAPKPKGKDLLLMILLLALALLTVAMMITFGLSMLFKDLIQGLIIAVVLICFGLSQFALFYVQSLAEKKHLIG